MPAVHTRELFYQVIDITGNGDTSKKSTCFCPIWKDTARKPKPCLFLDVQTEVDTEVRLDAPSPKTHNDADHAQRDDEVAGQENT